MEPQNPLDQYSMISVIGKGAYAKVMLVKKLNTGVLYALKSMKKKYIEKKKQQNRILTEKQILSNIKHPFLIGMKSSFQTDSKLFLVLQYCPGGQLFGLLVKVKKFNEQQARFYIGQIILAIQYLHKNNIIYRDLKPENILIDAQGYIKLTDFGLSKNKMSQEQNAFSVCGTPQYLAPEIIKKQGHGKAVDWWCLGSILYQLSYGLPPFYSNNRAQLFDRIKNGNPQISNLWSDNLKDLITKLLDKNPQTRLKFAENIKSHPWFSVLDWQNLLLKKIKPPFIPKINNETDVSNFDPQFTDCLIQSPADNSQKCNQFQNFSFERSPTGENPENAQVWGKQYMNQNFIMEIQQ